MTDSLNALVNQRDTALAGGRKLLPRGAAQPRTLCRACGRPYDGQEQWPRVKEAHALHCPEDVKHFFESRASRCKECQTKVAKEGRRCPCGGSTFVEVVP